MKKPKDMGKNNRLTDVCHHMASLGHNELNSSCNITKSNDLLDLLNLKYMITSELTVGCLNKDYEIMTVNLSIIWLIKKEAQIN